MIKKWKQKLFVAAKHPTNEISFWWIDRFKEGMCVAMGTRFYLLRSPYTQLLREEGSDQPGMAEFC